VWRTHGQNNRTILHCKYQHSSLQRTNWTVTNGMTKNCAATSKKFTDHCMTDARKYCKMLCLLMLRKLEKWYGSSSTPKLYQHSTPKSLLGGGHPLPRLHPSMCSRVILQTNRHTHTHVGDHNTCPPLSAGAQVKMNYVTEQKEWKQLETLWISITT